MKIKKHSRSEKNELFRRAGLLILVVAVVLVCASVVSRVVDQRKLPVASETASTEEELPLGTVEINGVKCVPKNNIRTYLFMGLDSRGESESKEDYDGTGQCDVLQVIVLDRTNNTYTRLPINRDTMTDVKSLDTDGTYLTTTEVQIALAHANGDGMEMSCENTVDAVSNLLYGQQIDGYVALNMDAIEILNRLAGGVTVTIEDDFSQSDPTLVQGETVTLTDEQAMHFVHDRMNVADGTNENRMKRQAQYLANLKPILADKCMEDNSFALDLYDGLEKYMVTDISRNGFIKLSAFLAESEEQKMLEIEGESSIGKLDYNEFRVNEDSLAEVVIQLFYDKLDK